MKSVKIDSLHMELFSGKKTKNLILDHLIEILLLASDYRRKYCGAVLSEIGKYLKYIAECGYEGCHCLRNVSGNHFR